MLRRIERLLSEPVLGFFALIALALALAPLIFEFSGRAERALDSLDWAIVAVFALEYAVKLALAPSKRAFVLAPWHILDLFIILTPLAALLPSGSEAFVSAPALRLLRIARVALLGAKTSGAVVREAGTQAPAPAPAPLEIHVVPAGKPTEVGQIGWEEFLNRLTDPDEEWYHVVGVRREDFVKVADALGIPAMLLLSKLVEAAHPRIDHFEKYTTLFAWYPEVRRPADGSPGLEVARKGTLIIGSAQNVVTLSRQQVDLHEAIVRALPAIEPAAPFLVRVVYALLKHLLKRYEEVIEALEHELRQVEALPARQATSEFLESAFHLKREAGAVRGDLWRFKGIIRGVADKRVAIHGFEPKFQALFSILADEADYLYETATNMREGLISQIELRLNIVSFEMNKVMRILALVTTLALVPTVVGGLLGMNLDGNPWPLSLSHVAFGVGFGMALFLYVFAIKGWLR